MPLSTSGTSGGTAVAAAIATNPGGIAPGTPVTDAQLQATWEAAITALYGNIVTNAEVEVTSVSGVTSGPSVSGPGTGTVE